METTTDQKTPGRDTKDFTLEEDGYLYVDRLHCLQNGTDRQTLF